MRDWERWRDLGRYGLLLAHEDAEREAHGNAADSSIRIGVNTTEKVGTCHHRRL